jgi:hypothetical protein
MLKKQKKTALQTPSRRQVSTASKPGLTVAEKKAERSAGTECVLDNHSHRTKERVSRCLGVQLTDPDKNEAVLRRMIWPEYHARQ